MTNWPKTLKNGPSNSYNFLHVMYIGNNDVFACLKLNLVLFISSQRYSDSPK